MAIAPTDEQRSVRRLGRGKKPAEGEQGIETSDSVTPPPKMRRRPLLVAASVAAVCLGALLAVLAFTSMNSAQEVLAVRSTVHRGEVITRDDLMTVRVGVDPALKPLPASELNDVVGKRAAMDLTAGGLVTSEDVTSSVVPGKGMSVVGISLAPGAYPANGLKNGDAVRIVLTPGQQGQYTSGSTPTEIPATVVDVAAGGSGGQQVVDVLVPEGQAPDVAAMAATGKAALVLDSRER
ncbi:SAF domain-containing protein [Branchiibius hedensis]|uniref:SAF domain-containing protein n=1 Tax=Branchiibius hedensis TaxID=672460 RepID=A0A2Y9BPI8_9MICO|nr:SAF domain-containing protein [Branchiibius hedensis]PWJ23361.1 SAF domain-containing protein [Branchiibius hedensis]SSA59050.1 SAF domain-containing protein [Branchiibius hedensis]